MGIDSDSGVSTELDRTAPTPNINRPFYMVADVVMSCQLMNIVM